MEAELPNPHEIEEHRANPFTQRVALCTAGIAVLLAVAGLLGRNAQEEAAMNQMRASDQWAFFQAKSARQFAAENDAKHYAAELAMLEALTKGVEAGEARAKLKSGMEDSQAAAARYSKEKEEIKAAATKHEEERNLYANRGGWYEAAEVLLQIAIVMASVSMLSSSRTVFIIALAVAAIGAGCAALGRSKTDHVDHEAHAPATAAKAEAKKPAL